MVSNLGRSQPVPSPTEGKSGIIDRENSYKQEQNSQGVLTVLGTGAWGSALATLASHNGHQVGLWSRSSEQSLEDALAGAEIIVSAIPMKGVATTAARIKEIGIADKVTIVTATKGLDPATTRTPSQIWQELFPGHPIVVLSGPNLSKEIEQGLPAATVVASSDIDAAEAVQSAFSSDRLRVYTSNDPIGVELGGTLKNVMAIACGVCDGLQLGTNAKSALITRALRQKLFVLALT